MLASGRLYQLRGVAGAREGAGGSPLRGVASARVLGMLATREARATVDAAFLPRSA